MSHLDLVMGRPTPKPTRAFLVFDNEFIIRIMDFEFPRAKELIEKVGEDHFDDTGISRTDMLVKNLDEATKWITEETDLIVEH